MREFPLVLSLDVTGAPHRWITYEDAAYYYAKDLVAWSMGDDFMLHGGISRMTGQQSTMKIDSIIAVKGQVLAKLGPRANMVPRLTNRALFRRDRNICGYCGQEYTTSHLTRDHIHPRSKGGQDVWMNCVTACSSCNKRKDDKTLDKSGMQLVYVPYEPNKAEYLLLMNRKVLADQMEFLIKMVPEHSRLHA